MLRLQIIWVQVEVDEGPDAKRNEKNCELVRSIADAILLIYCRNKLVDELAPRNDVEHPRKVL
jgi:hypothetical protein